MHNLFNQIEEDLNRDSEDNSYEPNNLFEDDMTEEKILMHDEELLRAH
jgi:hypothetical protein